MERLALFRRREIWIPTLYGWLVLLGIGFAVFAFAVRDIHGFLALNQPVNAHTLVVEGWMDPEGLDQAVATVLARGYDRVVTTGGPVTGWAGTHLHESYATLAAAYLKRHGLESVPVTAVPTPASPRDRTYLSAVAVRDWALRTGIGLDRIDVFSWDVHARRSRLLYRLAFGPNVRVGVYAGRTYDYDPGTWWRTSAGAKSVLEQAVGLLWVKCCFWPPAAGNG